MARRYRLTRSGKRPALPPRLIAIKQRFLWPRRYRMCRVRYENTFDLGLRSLSTLAGLSLFFILSYLLLHLALRYLVRTPLEECIFYLWNSVLHCGCLVYSGSIELTAAFESREHMSVREMTKQRLSVSGLLLHAATDLPATRLDESNESDDTKITIFVMGSSLRTVALRVQPNCTVSDIAMALQSRRAIAPLERIRQYIVFPSYSQAPLCPEDRLRDIGARDLSTLHIRTSVMGGSSRTRNRDPVAFTKDTGFINAEHPEDWQALTGVWFGYFKCRLCKNTEPVHRHWLRKHEDTKGHKRRRIKRDTGNSAREGDSSAQTGPVSATTAVSGSSARPPSPFVPSHFYPSHDPTDLSAMDAEDAAGFVPDLDVRSPLLAAFDDWQSNLSGPNVQSSQSSLATATPFTAVDWARITDMQRLESTTEEAALARITAALRAYILDSGEIDRDSDDDDESNGEQEAEEEELRVEEESERIHQSRDSSETTREQGSSDSGQGVRPSRFVTDKDSIYFPWPDRETCILDVLRHIPRCAFSEKQNAVIHWALLAMGIKDLPSEHTMDRVTRVLQRIYGVSSIRYKGAMGHIYYVNDMAALIAQELANPQVRKHLHFLPEDAGKRLSEAWQGSRWLRELDPDLATPMVRIHEQDFYVLEPAQLRDGRVCMPVRFFTRGKDTFAYVWTMVPTHNGNGWVIAQDAPLEVKVYEFLTSLPYNVHFLATSNSAPPLEMLDGIAEQLSCIQASGIWAWDCELEEMVLLVPSVLAIVGDNPMQSEIACHVGMRGNMFCRMCMASSGHDDDDDDDDDASVSGAVPSPRPSRQRKKKRKAGAETMTEMIDRIKRFMTINAPRTREETTNILKSQFIRAQRVGGQAEYKRTRTETGVKDTYQLHFAERLFRVTTQRGVSRSAKEAEVARIVQTVPRAEEEGATSPVWCIKDFDPHLDTPVEILHVILLGFVKYFWRDAMSRLKPPEKEQLVVRLNSFDVSGLGFPPLSGATLVNYAGSLVGRDFRALAQVAPFVLHDFSGIPKESIEVWTALSHIIPLVWQPDIDDIDAYTAHLKQAIDKFLDVTCKLTPRWFNKPKFHILLHLPDHIRRFGPAMLFATEGFESFNAVIRSHSIHSNHRAPSRDIALAMAQSNRIRHLLSGGYFRQVEIFNEKDNDARANQVDPERSPWLHIMASIDVDRVHWRCAGAATADILALNHFATNHLVDESDIGEYYIYTNLSHLLTLWS
ncbi:hypothetical protein OH76DRAFT_1463653 [Lentinus brumalis]|uniref:Ubiquitin-like domain-containing protein n=1 Tax=Lentinus brumalis TaxID=2498619 RepID=A0A371DDX6_9APHY|nr:hypothetical protein OH76DRAFT_1463653 [Polyporus brumalis]